MLTSFPYMGRGSETIKASESLEALNASFVERNHGYAEDVRRTLREAVRLFKEGTAIMPHVAIRTDRGFIQIPGFPVIDPNPDPNQEFLHLATGDAPKTVYFLNEQGDFQKGQREYDWRGYQGLVILPRTIEPAEDEAVIRLGKIAIDLIRHDV